MLYPLKAYLKFLARSTNQHGVHSPFVFDLVTNCFYDPTRYPAYELLKDYRESLLENTQTIEVTDYGVGSRVFSSNQRKVNQIAKTAGIRSSRSRLLFRLVKYFQPYYILELGSSLGLATHAMHLGHPDSKIISLEGCKNTLEVAEQQFLKQYTSEVFEKLSFVSTEFDTFLEDSDLSFLTTQTEKWNLVYFDGNHSKAATLRYVVKLLPTLTNQTLWVFDDIHWSRDMEEAWDYIKNLPEVTVTIDTFQWGLVFFRKEQAKEHFVVRV